MVNFKKTHNITKEQNFRSLIGYAGQELVISRLMMCGYNVLRSLWRDSKYDGMFEANNASIKIEIKQTTQEKFIVTSGSRSGGQISRSAESREAILKKEDADFFFGVSTVDATCWMMPIELIEICKRKSFDFKHIEIFKEKFKIFLGFPDLGLTSRDIKEGFFEKTIDELEFFFLYFKIRISNINKHNKFNYPKNILLGDNSERLGDIIVDYKQSLVIDIWIFLFNKIQ